MLSLAEKLNISKIIQLHFKYVKLIIKRIMIQCCDILMWIVSENLNIFIK